MGLYEAKKCPLQVRNQAKKSQKSFLTHFGSTSGPRAQNSRSRISADLIKGSMVPKGPQVKKIRKTNQKKSYKKLRAYEPSGVEL